jgi:mono/diheme cytochrome c family protein
MYSDGLFLFVIAASLSAQAPPPTSSADLLPGRRIFEGQCAPCHGIHGEGGRGPTLHVSRLRHAPDDTALADLLQNGIPGTGMPGFFLSEGETAQVSAYVRGLGTQPAAPVSGDAARGRTVYQTAGCPTCHIAEGAGRALGPDLSEAGARRTTQGRTGTAMGVPATTSIPVRCWLYARKTGPCNGTSSSPRTTTTTGMPPRSRFCSRIGGMAAPGSW